MVGALQGSLDFTHQHFETRDSISILIDFFKRSVTHPRLPLPVQPLLDEFLSRMGQQLPGLLVGFYVVGFIALGGFDEHFSDIDFVAVLARPLSTDEIECQICNTGYE